MFIIILFILIIGILLTLISFSLSISFLLGPPFVPTPKKIVKKSLDLVKISKKDILVDLGSGDGVVLIEAAKRGAHAIGYETNPFLVVWSRIRAKIMGTGQLVKVYQNKYQNAQLNVATIVFCYNLPKYMPYVSKKLIKELPSNAKIISFQFVVPGLKIIQKTTDGIYIYKKR